MGFLKDRKGRKAYEAMGPVARAITFYAEDGGSWPHLGPIVEELVGRLDRQVCYLTSSPDDPVLERADGRLHVFAVGDSVQRAAVFASMEAGVVVMTVPELGDPRLPRSRLAGQVGTDYVYVFHSMMSTHMIYKPHAFDRYDTVLCVGPYMEAEVRAREAAEGLAPKELVAHGYGRLDSLLSARDDRPGPDSDAEHPHVLVAPSWGPSCLFEAGGAPLVAALLDAGCRVTARPHPMTVGTHPEIVDELLARFGGDGRFALDTDMASRRSLETSHLMISDWSGAALEYAFGLERPVLFVDVPRKVLNDDYRALGIEPFEVTVRDLIGRVVAADDVSGAAAAALELVAEGSGFASRLAAVRDEHVHNVGSSAEVAADVIAAKADRYMLSWAS